MGIINRLDEHLSNMIAAGEVVERPMGVIKELVENSIDAQATHIEIALTQGGIESISIRDDGIGMEASDASLAFERHATSKIKNDNDLWNIHTLGFRGEALPSIAAVAAVNLKTNNGKDSTEVEIQYGKLIKVQNAASPRGTQIVVRNLFQKTPARFKHLKTPQYEFSLCVDLIQKFALSHPEIAFSLSHDDRMIFQSNGSNQLLEVLMQIYGREIAKSAIEINKKDMDYKVSGYAIQPNFNRATKYYILLYVNERMIRSYRLQKAVLDAYHPYMAKDRYPIVVLNIDMDAQLVDVNVHPSKWEIRLSKENQLEKLVFDSLDLALKEKLQVTQVAPKEKDKIEIQTLHFEYENNKPIINLPEVNKEEKEVAIDLKELSEEVKAIKENKIETIINEESVPYEKAIAQPVEIIGEESKEVSVACNESFPNMQVLAQMHGRYILAQGDEGLYIIDQHAAQERYHYEVISKMIEEGNRDAQPLLFPISIETSLSVIAQYEAMNQVFLQLGIQLEVFGDHTLIARELPVWMKDCDEVAFIQDMIDVYQQDHEISLDRLRKKAIATMACHSSIRFNRNLSLDEMKQVVDDLKKCVQPFHCPHGRPTFICMSEKQLEKEFERTNS
ncbi:MAG: DNA mismatch repair endonuclease MutL [Erysipelotrichaceae bacterium]